MLWLDSIPTSTDASHLLEDAYLEHGEGAEAVAQAIIRFNEAIIEAIAADVVAVKPQVAFYERLGAWGFLALEKTLAMAKEQGLLVIVDGSATTWLNGRCYAEAYRATARWPGMR